MDELKENLIIQNVSVVVGSKRHTSCTRYIYEACT